MYNYVMCTYTSQTYVHVPELRAVYKLWDSTYTRTLQKLDHGMDYGLHNNTMQYLSSGMAFNVLYTHMHIYNDDNTVNKIISNSKCRS